MRQANPKFNKFLSETIVKKFEEASQLELKKYHLESIELRKEIRRLHEEIANIKNGYVLFLDHFEQRYKKFQEEQAETVRFLEAELALQKDQLKAQKNVCQDLEFRAKNLATSVQLQNNEKRIDELKTFINEQGKKNIFCLSKLLSDAIESFQSKMDIQNRSNLNNFEKLKKENDDLSKNLEIYKIDAKGLLRELQVYKRENFIIEKKIEDLYNKLRKQKAGEK